MSFQGVAVADSNADPSTTSRPRVLFINRSYWPDAEATGQLLTELCQDLAADFDVWVLCGQPNWNPSGAAYRSSGVQAHDNVHIRRVRHFRFPKSSLVLRAANLLSFLAMAIPAALFLPKPAVIVVETDPPLLCLLGRFLTWWRDAKLVVYLQDIYPDVAVALGKLRDSVAMRGLRRLFFSTYQRADRVVVLSEDMKQLLKEGGVAEERLARVPNWTDTSSVFPVKSENPFRLRHGLQDHFVVMYSGNMGLSQGLEVLLDVADRLRDRPIIRFLLVGEGATRPSLEAQAHRLNLPNLHFLGYQPKGELHESLSAADLQVVMLDPKLARLLMPSKLYGILAAGTAVLAAAPEKCELADLTRREQVGLVVSYGDAAAIAATIDWAAGHPDELAEMGRRARHLAVAEYDRRRSTNQFGRLLEKLVEPAQVTQNG